MLVNAHKRGLTSSQFEAKLGDGSDASEEDWKEIIREIHSSGTTLRGLYVSVSPLVLPILFTWAFSNLTLITPRPISESIRRISYLRLGRASPK